MGREADRLLARGIAASCAQLSVPLEQSSTAADAINELEEAAPAAHQLLGQHWDVVRTACGARIGLEVLRAKVGVPLRSGESRLA